MGWNFCKNVAGLSDEGRGCQRLEWLGVSCYDETIAIVLLKCMLCNSENIR